MWRIIIEGFKEYKELKINNDLYDVPVECNKLQSYSTKVVQSGNIVEVYQYAKPMYRNYTRRPIVRVKNPLVEWSGKLESNIYRSRRSIRRIIWANMHENVKFLTLTYEENMRDISRFFYDFKVFKMYLNRNGVKLKYLAVIEYQERGAIHCHLVLFNREFIPWQIIRKCWKHGNIDINKNRDIKNLGAYVCKYLTKDTLREYGSKSYFCSKGLSRSIEKVYKKEYLTPLDTPSYVSCYNVQYGDIVANSVMYSQYKL